MTTSPTLSAVLQSRYWCFISYRHADNKEPGRQWASWLQHQIENYEVPEELVGTINERGEVIPERIFPVFRDEEELPADADLGCPIYRALDRSLFLLVLCSPQSVQSTYVANEIAYFKRLGRSHRVLAAMIEGEPNASWDEGRQRTGVDPTTECFPQPLQFMVDANGELDYSQRAEPIAADFRLPDGSKGWTSTEALRQALPKSMPKAKVDEVVAAYHQQCELARLKIIAGILGVPLGMLTKRDKAYQLEKERQRTRVFRRVATALGILAVAAAGGGLLAYLKRQEAVVNGQRAIAAEYEANSNLNRATGLLWEASSNAWNEAERSYRDGDPQAALAYIASGMRNAPANTGLLTFAACVMAESTHPLRTLSFDLPVTNVAYTRPENTLIVAELYYSAGTRYSLWNPETAEKLDEVVIAADSAITGDQRKDRPWLEFAPPPLAGKSTEDGALDVAWSPCGMRCALNMQPRVKVKGEGISWNHPWFDSNADEPTLTVPKTECATSYSWSADGSVLATSHSSIDMVDQGSGRVDLWDLRTAFGFTLQPDEVTPASEINPDDALTGVESPDAIFRSDGDYLIGDRENGAAIFRKGGADPLWTLASDSGKETLVLSTFGSAKEAVVLRCPVSVDDAGEGAPALLTLERRSMDTGEILGMARVEVPRFTSAEFSKFTLQVARHPQGKGYACGVAAFILAWDGTASPPTLAPDPGPRDDIGFSGPTSFLPDGNSLLVGQRRKLLHLKWPEMTVIAGPRYHETMVSALSVSNEGRLLVSGAGFGDGAGSAGYAQVWTLPDLLPTGPRLNHASNIERVSFLGEGSTFVSSTNSPDGSDMRIWDSKTSLPLTNYIAPPVGTGQAFLTYDNYRPGELSVITARGEVDAFGKGTYSARLPTPSSPVPAWFHEHFLPFVCCKILSPEGSLKPVPATLLHEHYKQVQAKLAKAPPEQDDVYLSLARWQLSNPSARSLSPFTSQTRDDFLELYFFLPIRGGKSGIDTALAYAIDPGHPLLHLHLALNEANQEKRLRYINYGYYRLTRPTNEEIYGRERWNAHLRVAQNLLTLLKQPEAVEKIEKILSRN
jgi:hypothetical protein